MPPKGSKKVTQKTLESTPAQDPIASLNVKFDALLEIVGDLAQKVQERDVTKPEPTQEVDTRSEDEIGEDRINQADDMAQMYPRRWTEILDRILGPGFELEIRDTANGDFRAFIYVPQKFDRRVGIGDHVTNRDFSVGPIRRSSPEADIEYWCLRMRENLQKESKSYAKVYPKS